MLLWSVNHVHKIANCAEVHKTIPSCLRGSDLRFSCCPTAELACNSLGTKSGHPNVVCKPAINLKFLATFGGALHAKFCANMPEKLSEGR